jgi:hypothetical protein
MGLQEERRITRGYGCLCMANSKSYIWAPLPVIADVALEECLKSVHKCMDAYHVDCTPPSGCACSTNFPTLCFTSHQVHVIGLC